MTTTVPTPDSVGTRLSFRVTVREDIGVWVTQPTPRLESRPFRRFILS